MVNRYLVALTLKILKIVLEKQLELFQHWL